MRRIQISVLCAGLMLLGLSQAKAQLPSLMLLSKDTALRSSNAWVMASGSAHVGSNALDMEFLRKLTLGGRITDEHIDRLAGDMHRESRAGYAAFGELTLMNFRDTLFVNPAIGLKATVGSYYHGYAGFSSNMFSAVFQGNQRTAGSSVELGPAFMMQQSWQKFGLGIFDKRTLSAISLSLVEGQSYRSLVMNNAALYTSALGDTVSIAPDGEYMRSDTSRSGWANGSGVGLALDLDYNLALPDDQGFVNISIRDLGVVFLNEDSERYAVSREFTWTGFDANPWLINHEDSLVAPSPKDSLLTSREQTTFTAALPMTFQLRYVKQFGKGHFYEAGWNLWPNRVAKPQVFVGVTHRFRDDLLITARAFAGGYSRWGMGAEVQWMPKGTWLLRAGSNHLVGLIADKAHGAEAFVSIGKSF
jgi:hypothetical protein